MNLQLLIKRLLDLLGSLVGLTILIIPFLIIAVLIRISKSSVFFKQIRPGKNGEMFSLYKFRTMNELRDENGSLLPDEKRITNIGKLLRKLSLDELPELWNVLKGDMSLVGSRPLLVEYLGRYTPEQARRHEVKPGITGWAQVNGRNAITWEEKFKYDVWYVDNWNLWLDIKIIFMTLVKVIKKEGISQPGHVTMEEFKGNINIMKERFKNWKYPKIEENKLTKYNWMVQHKENLKLGFKTDIGAFTYINAKYGVIIEDYVEIGSHCSIYSASTIDKKKGKVILKKNCKIGSHSVIMPGVTIGENSVIGAFSFVNKDIPPNVVAMGIPVRIKNKDK